MTTLQEAADQLMTGCVLIVWACDDKHRRTSLFHVQVNSGDRTVCGRRCAERNWAYRTYSIPSLAGRVAARENLCSECIRQLSRYDFSSGKEPSRITTKTHAG